MTGWRAVVPVNFGGDCKTRLAARLARAARDALVEAMARHVVGQVLAAGGIVGVDVLSPRPPPFAGAGWIADRGRGLNAELADALGGRRVIILHADLPLLGEADLVDLMARAEEAGAAIAPDRAGTGTNAVALVEPAGFRPAFGEASFARHARQLPGAAIVRRRGLACDVDTIADLDRALAAGAACIAGPI